MLRAVGLSPSTDVPSEAAIIRLRVTAVIILLGAAAATYLLVTGWTSNACLAAASGQSNPSCAAVSLGLIGAALLLTVVAVLSVFQDRREVMAAAREPTQVVARGVRGVRWSAVFAIGLSVLLYTDCSGSTVSGTGGSMADPARFWSLAPWLIIPLAIALAVPAVLANIARLQLARQLPSAGRTAALAALSTALVVLVAVITAGAGLVFGIPACYLFSTGPSLSPSTCAAGLGSIANIVAAAAAVALVLPYLLMIRSAIAREPGLASAYP